MATTIFPIQDQTATTALFTSLKTAVDRGLEDPLTPGGFDNQSYDGTKLKYTSTTSGSKADATYTTLHSRTISEGDVFLFECQIAVQDLGTASPSDNLNYRITVDSGIVVRGFYLTKSGNLADSYAESVPIYTTSSQTVFGRIGTTTSDNILSVFRFVAVGDTGGGEVKIEWAKATNSYANTFGPSYSRMSGHRITR